jgi:riboflavin kinase/FMN adenylyltransferase
VTIGSFDGVHLGHQRIIKDLVNRSQKNGVPSAVITFHPHPQLVINDEKRPYYLTMPDDRASLLGEMGVEIVLTHPFERSTSQKPANIFVKELQDRFHFSELWVGYDFALGKDREGTPARLKELGEDYGYSVHEIPAFIFEDEPVSSSGIRKKIRAGDIKTAASLLGRPFMVKGKVIKGENRGKSLGFPTSNLKVAPEIVDIKPGVYACLAQIQGKDYKAVTNIGFRPTFGAGIDTPRIEAHLLDFSQDLYGKELRLSFIDRLRDEMKFENVTDLINQIQSDIDKARHILNE